MPSLWIVPEESGGIRTYSEVLLAKLGGGIRAIWHLPEPAELSDSDVDLIHLQHEFGLFGSKLPGLNRFPKWFDAARRASPQAKWVATAHTVLDERWRYRTTGRGGKALAYAGLNLVAPLLRRNWMERTWSGFDGVIVHSEHQRSAILRSGQAKVAVIPHFVPRPSSSASSAPTSLAKPEEPVVLVFGYLSPEKGQDVAIRAWAELGADAPKLILAGGVRRAEDQGYYASCVSAIQRSGLTEKVTITGYVPPEQIPSYFASATLVLAPFRETSGSGSLATALGYGAAILASDLPLNREIDARVSGSVTFFRSESPASLAAELRKLLGDRVRRASLREGARRYAESYSPERIAAMHSDFYREILGTRGSSE